MCVSLHGRTVVETQRHLDNPDLPAIYKIIQLIRTNQLFATIKTGLPVGGRQKHGYNVGYFNLQ